MRWINQFIKENISEVKTEVKTEAKTETEKPITSKDIKEDIHLTFAEVLEELNVQQSKEGKVDSLKAKLNSFKKENKEIYDKVEKLTRFGFTNTPSASQTLVQLKNKEGEINREINVIENQIKKTKEISDLNDLYGKIYPSYKFIDRDTMISIMKKYDLVMGHTFMYAKEIPTKSLSLIDNFSDEIVFEERNLIASSYVTIPSSDSYEFRSAEPKILDALEKEYKRSMSMHQRERIVETFKYSNLKMVAPESHFNIPCVDMYDWNDNYLSVPVFKIDEETRMFTEDTEKVSEIEKKRREVLDPIASLEVKGGYIIIDAWDKEADIPEIKNPKTN